jgi:hypothetical protein
MKATQTKKTKTKTENTKTLIAADNPEPFFFCKKANTEQGTIK